MPLFTSTPSYTKQRRNSTKMSTSPQGAPAMMPYRDNLTGTIKYASPASPPPPNAREHYYDSDAEPLVPADEEEQTPSGLSEYEQQHFTATGRPAPQFKASALANLGGHMYLPPQLLPKQYTDDSIIPAIITDIIPSPKDPAEAKTEKKGLLSKLKSSKKEDERDGKMLKVVYMPRREYQKYFARNNAGGYVGTEEHRRWTEDELEEAYGRYKPEPTQRKKEGLLSGTGGTGTGTSGALSSFGTVMTGS